MCQLSPIRANSCVAYFPTWFSASIRYLMLSSSRETLGIEYVLLTSNESGFWDAVMFWESTAWSSRNQVTSGSGFPRARHDKSTVLPSTTSTLEGVWVNVGGSLTIQIEKKQAS